MVGSGNILLHASKIICSRLTKKKTKSRHKHYGGTPKVAWQNHGISDGSFDEPNKNKPTCPIETKEHENTTDKSQNRSEVSKGEIDRVGRYKHSHVRSGIWVCHSPEKSENRYDTNQDKYPTNNCHGEWAFHCMWVPKVEQRRRKRQG